MGNSRKISGLFFIIFLLPVFFHNFFRIRSDQVAFFLFSLMLWMISKKKHQLAFLILFFIPFFGIKEIIFWIPGLLLLTPFLKSKWQVQTWRFRIFVLGFMVTLLIWLIAFNVNAISYFLETFQNESFPGNHLKNYFEFEWPLILSSLVLIAISYQKEDLAGRCSLGAAILSLLLIISLPQSYPFYIASLCLIFYAPLIRFIYNNFSEKKNRLSVALLILVQILNILFFSYKEKFPLYTSSYQQFLFINLGSRIMTKYGFSYLDGMGIFPRQKFIPCFVSPEDLEANVGCLNRIKSHEAESIIVTQRLSFLGEEIFKLIAINYVQIRPNFWIEKKSINRLEKNEMDVLSGPLPILIFGF